LVVDDNATNRRILEEMLSHWGMRVTAAESGAAALKCMRRAAEEGEPFPVGLLDVMMPEMDGFTLVDEIRKDPTIASTKIILLSSADRQKESKICQELGIAVYLMKPCKQSDILAALARALRLSLPGGSRTPAVGLPEIHSGSGGLRLLLAEDNLVNQRFAIRLLEKRGHSVCVANNGREVIRALESEPFDLVLMDVQMPEMDGLEATRIIRANEEGKDRRIPIIAMTAHAMKGDKDRCLESGMDGYVAKPIQAADLFTALAELVPPAPVHEENLVEAN
jgi:two-component system sensor histidine kinase/response regulator